MNYGNEVKKFKVKDTGYTEDKSHNKNQIYLEHPKTKGFLVIMDVPRTPFTPPDKTTWKRFKTA